MTDKARSRAEAAAPVYRRTTCRFCGGGDLEMVLRLPPTPPADHYFKEKRSQRSFPIELAFCRNCTAAALLDVVDPEILYGNYVYVTQTSLGLPDHFVRYADSVIERVRPPNGALVVEFGSNDGTLLRCFKQRGMRIVGVDPAREVAKKATANGIETRNAYFTPETAKALAGELGRAAIVIANNVVANIDDLDAVAEGLRSLLAPDGVFLVESGYVLDTIGNDVFDNIYHEHLSYLSVRPLEAFFRRTGLELIDIEHVNTKGGSIRGTVQLSGGPRKASAAVAGMIDEESRRGFDRPDPYRELGKRIERMKDEALSFFAKAEREGKSVAGFGASTSVTTLLYAFAMGDKFSFIVDDNPIKQNTYSPGHHIPVFDPGALREKKPGYAMILPWRYAEPISKKHEYFSDQGGRFVVPVPKLKVL